MKAIAVVGGTGFLGGYVSEALARDSYSVRVLSRRTGFDALRPNPEDFRGVDAVVNLAGIKREEGGQTFQFVHVDLVRLLVEQMQSAGVQRLVHISVVVARPESALPYHDTKWTGEEIVRTSKLDWTILHPGVIYGKDDDMLSHLALMIRTSPVFPIVGDGSSPMRPVDARDVAASVVAALQKPCFGKTYDIVGPDRLDLRDVVKRVADAMGLRLSIWPTPAALMRIPVRIMEATMRQPLSTRAQLAMLAEGLDGNPAAARNDLGLVTAPFIVARLRPLLGETTRTAPFNLRLFSAPKPAPETSALAFWLLFSFAMFALTFVFLRVPDRWTGMTAAMGIALVGSSFVGAVRRRLRASLFLTLAGIGAGTVLYGITLVVVAVLRVAWPGWETAARELYAWRGHHSPLFLGPTLVMIVFAEELLWRGVVSRYLMECWGKGPGILAAAAIYALAHTATFDPLLLSAALGCGLFWGWLYAVTDNLVAPAISHLLWDALMLFVFPVVR